MVMNGGQNSTIGGAPQFPRPLLPQTAGLSNFPSGPSPFPPLPSAMPSPLKTDSLSLSTASRPASFAPGGLMGNPAPTMPAFAPLSLPSSTFLPVSTSHTNLSDQFSAANRPTSAPANNTSLLPPLPSAAQTVAASASESAASSASAIPSASATANLPVKPAPVNGASPAGALSQAVGPNGLSPAQQTGKQVGDIVTKLLEEVPALQEKIDQIDWEALSQEEVMPKLEKLRARVQPTFTHVPKFVDRKIARLFEDPKSQQMAGQFFEWLRKEPDPETLAALESEGRNRPGRNGLDEEEGPRPNRHRPSRASEDDFADDELPSEKPGLLGRMRNRVKDAYSSLKDRLPFRKSDDKLSSHSSKPGSRFNDDDFGGGPEDELDLDSLLRGASRGGRSSLDELGGSGGHRHRPMRDEY